VKCWKSLTCILSSLAATYNYVCVLCVMTALEFAYTESPVAMQGMVMGMNHVTTGLGALLASAIYNAIAVATASTGKQ